MTGVASAMATLTGVAPHFAATPASLARRPYRDFERHGGTGARLTTRQVNLGAERVGAAVGFDERVAHSLDLVAHCRKVDGDFVGE